VIARLQPLDVREHLVERLGLQRGAREARMIARRLQRTAAAQHEAHAEAGRFVEQQVAGLGGAARVIQVVMIGAGRDARQQQFGEAEPRGDARERRREARDARIGHRREPCLQIGVDAGRHRFQQVLEQMVMRVDPARIDDAVARVDHTLAGLRREIGRDRFDPAVADAQVGAGEPRGGARAAAHDRERAANQQGSRRKTHDSVSS